MGCGGATCGGRVKFRVMVMVMVMVKVRVKLRVRARIMVGDRVRVIGSR
jgi:hypothetical protein